MAGDPEPGGLTDGSDAKAKGFAAPCFEGRCWIMPPVDQLATQGEQGRGGRHGEPGRRTGVVADQVRPDRHSLRLLHWWVSKGTDVIRNLVDHRRLHTVRTVSEARHFSGRHRLVRGPP
jgi:hypothetical protein